MMPIFCLYITFPKTGYVRVETFSTAFDRALFMVGLSAQPVTLRIQNYAEAAEDLKLKKVS